MLMGGKRREVSSQVLACFAFSESTDIPGVRFWIRFWMVVI